MPAIETLIQERDGRGIATLTFNRPALHNALDWATMEAFAAAVEALAAEADAPDSGLRAVILTGAGREAFCSGGDQRALHRDLTEADGRRLAQLMGDALLRLEALPVPVIAAVNGHALGGGSEIALACDLRVVDEALRFGLVHLRLGLIPGWGGGQRLLRLVGHGRAMALLLGAEAQGAEELRALGLADRIAPAGAALPLARSLAESIAAADPACVRAIKQLLAAGLRMPYAEALAEERALFPGLWAAEAHVLAVRRFAARGEGS